MYIYVFGRFSSSKNEKKMCEKQKEKKKKRKGATETDLGYCPNCVTIQWKIVS